MGAIIFRGPAVCEVFYLFSWGSLSKVVATHLERVCSLGVSGKLHVLSPGDKYPKEPWLFGGYSGLYYQLYRDYNKPR